MAPIRAATALGAAAVAVVAVASSCNPAERGMSRPGVPARLVQARTALADAQNHGLDPSAYGLDSLDVLLDSLTADPGRADRNDVLGAAERVAEAGLLGLRGDLEGGVAPEKARPEGFPVRSASHVGQNDAWGPVDEFAPAHPEYRSLVEWLAVYRELAARGEAWTTLPEDVKVEPGDSGAVVVTLRDRLAASPDPRERELATRGTAPAVFDSALVEALTHAQRRHGLEPDGVLGARTARALNVPASERARQIALTLERWRWLPEDFDERAVWVNIPSYDLVVFDGGRSVLTMPVVVGQAGWPTIAMADSIRTVVFNPYWNIPSSILWAETIPKQRKDPSYMPSGGFEVVDESGAALPPSSIDWSSVERGSFPYRVRQAPGASNALGRVKFLFPNRHNIYLHDTPSRSLFERAERAFSHGCVRVGDPVALARVLVSLGAARTDRSVETLLQGDDERHVALGRPVPVWITYLTVRAPDGDGAPRFFDDIYGHDADLADVLRPVSRAEDR